MVTMQDVAREAGVSITTVSHVINGTRPASPQTTRRVLDAVERTGYTQNTIARALARARTQSVGLVLSGSSNPHLADVVVAVEGAAAREGLTVLIGDTADDPQQELRIVRALVQRRVDGLVLAPSPGAGEHALPYLATQALPVVLIDRFWDAPLDQVGSDNEQPTAALVAHLAGNGHRRIAMVAGLAGISTTTERLRGYELGLGRAGLARDPDLVVCGESQRDEACAATLRLLDLPRPPTAIVSGNNFMTIGVMRALAQRGLRVPDDLAVVGFDDFEWADLFHPRLTVVAQPAADIGARAAELLLARLRAPARPPRTVRLPATLVHRDSCGCGRELPMTG